MPVFYGHALLREGNDCHEPAGKTDGHEKIGGRFARKEDCATGAPDLLPDFDENQRLHRVLLSGSDAEDARRKRAVAASIAQRLTPALVQEFAEEYGSQIADFARATRPPGEFGAPDPNGIEAASEYNFYKSMKRRDAARTAESVLELHFVAHLTRMYAMDLQPMEDRAALHRTLSDRIKWRDAVRTFAPPADPLNAPVDVPVGGIAAEVFAWFAKNDGARTLAGYLDSDRPELIDPPVLLPFEEWFSSHYKVSPERAAELHRPTDESRAAEVAGFLVHQWAETSGNQHPIAVGLQLEAAEMFGVDGAYTDRFEGTTGAWGVVNRHGPLLREFLQAQYDATQTHLKGLGLTHVTVFRGMDLDPQVLGDNVGGMWADLRLQPLSSFSTSAHTAQTFGDHVLVARVPIARVLSTPLTGNGCSGEKEVVVLGPHVSAFVLHRADFHQVDDEVRRRSRDVEPVWAEIIRRARDKAAQRSRATAPTVTRAGVQS